jgi:GWxTD domain-containing protein
MKRITLILLMLLLASTTFAREKGLSALFGYSAFFLPESNRPYVETYLNFDASSLNLVKDASGQYRATVEITIVVRKGDTVAYVKKYDLHSPYTSSAEANNFTFFDLQRFALDNGIYDLQLTLRDKASEQAPAVLNDRLVVYFQNETPSMSNIQLMSTATPTEVENMLSRNGYDMLPYINDFVPANIAQLHPYIEVYNLDKELDGKPYVVYFSIEQKETSRRIAAFDTFISRPASKKIDPIFGSVDISTLPSGNYNLVAEVRNMKGETLRKKRISFQRSNPGISNDEITEDHVAASFVGLITDETKLNYYIRALYPVSSPNEVSVADHLLKSGNMAEKQSFFYRFWLDRDMMDPESKWNEYLVRLTYVDENYSYPKTPGYMTDRGRVYLQYGPPDYVRDEKNFVGALNIEGLGQIHYLPYQLWRYNRLENDFPNRVFLFWDEFRSGYYKLLNSNARGEIIMPNWERMLSQNQLEEDVQGEVGQQFERGF